MYNMETILAQLQNGQDPEAIAQQFADVLNAAIQKQNELEMSNTHAAKVTALMDIIGAVVDFINDFYPEVGLADNDLKITEEDVSDLVDELDEAMPQVVELMNAVSALDELLDKKAMAAAPKQVTPIKVKPVTKVALDDVNFNDAISQFLKQNGLM